ncbi:MAG: Calx-beta domain-containing protein [Leptospirales bacterium]
MNINKGKKMKFTKEVKVIILILGMAFLVNCGGGGGTSGSGGSGSDTTAPDAPSTPDLNTADDLGVSSTDDITALLTGVTFDGTAEADSTVEIYKDGVATGVTGTATGGNYSIDLTLTDGVYAITAIATDSSGNASSESTGLSVTIDSAAPGSYSAGTSGAVNPVLSVASDTGVSSVDGVTNLTTGLVFNGSLGTTNPNAVINLYSGGVLVGTATTDVNGDYSLTTGAVNSGAITFVIMTPSGILSSSFATSVTLGIDVTTPTYTAGVDGAVNPALDSTTDNGISQTDTITNISTGLKFQGSLGLANANEYVEVFVGGTSVGTTQVDASGNYLLGPTVIDAGAGGAVTFVISDEAGNTTGSLASGTITIEKTIPAISSFSSSTGVGIYGIGSSINITVNFTEAVTLSGGGSLDITLNSGAVVSITSIVNTTPASVTYVVAGGDADVNPLDVDSIALTGTLIDEAGNNANTVLPAAPTNKLAAELIEVLTTAPSISTITSTIAPNPYGIGSVIDVTVTFDALVSLSAGSLDLTLDSGGSISIPAASITNTLTATGNYTVAATEDSTDLDVTNIVVNTGALTGDGSGANVGVGLPASNLANNEAIVIDTTAPTLTPVSIVSDNAINSLAKDGDLITVTFTSDEVLTPDPVVTIAGNAATVTDLGGGTSWKAEYTLAGTETEGDVPFNIAFSDVAQTAANAGTPVTVVTDSSSVTYDKTLPTISSSSLDSSNGFIDLTFSEGVYHTGSTPLTATDLTLAFIKDGTGTGSATNVTILSIKKPDSTVNATASALTGSETVVRVFLTVTGTPNGFETIEVLTKDGGSAESVFDHSSNASLVTTTTTAVNLNKASTVDFNVTSSSGSETNADHVVNFQLDLDVSSATPITVNYTISGSGTYPATGGSVDYVNSTSVVILAGNTTYDLPITIKGDTTDEFDETYTITLTTGTGYMLGTNTTYTYTITDDDAAPTVQFTAASQSSADETNSSTLTVTAQLSALSGKNVDVPFTLTGTGALNTDYTITASPVNISAGTLTKDVTITIVGDVLDEDDETAIITMGTATNATASGTTVHTATIVDDDAMPTVSINSVSLSEGDAGTTSFVFNVTLSAVSGRTTSVKYATADNTATLADTDYVQITPATLLSFTAGQTTKTVTVLVNGDSNSAEVDETFNVDLTVLTNINPTGSTVQGTGTILNDDTSNSSVSFASASSSGSESVAAPTYAVNLSPAAPVGGLTVYYTITGTGTYPATNGGTDFTGTGTLSVIVPAGLSSYNITVPVNNDALDEFDEDFTISLSTDPDGSTGGQYNLGAQTTHGYTITDNDAVPQVSFQVSSTATTNESTALNVVVNLSSVSGKDVTVDVSDTTIGGVLYAVAPGDYSLTRTSGIQLTISAGNPSANVVLTPVNDSTDETNGGLQAGEMVTMSLSNPGNSTLGAITSHTAMITDDDGQPNFSVTDVSALEATGSVDVTITCVAFSCTGFTVDYATANGTAVAGTDYTATSGTASTWTGSAPNWSKTVTISVTNESLAESDETVLFNLSGNSGSSIISNATAFITITNDDTPLTIANADTLDCNGGQNGKIDTYRVELTEAVTDSTFNGYALDAEGSITGNWFVLGYSNVRMIHGAALNGECGTDTEDDTFIYLRFDEGTATDTGVVPDLTASASTISATSGHGKLYYNTGNVASGDVAEADFAGPYIWKTEAFDTGVNNNSGNAGAADTLIVYFTESTNAAALSGVDLDTIFTLGAGNFAADTDITSATWSTTTNTNDTLTVVFANGATTVAPAVTVTLIGTTVTDAAGNNPGASMLSVPSIIGAFDTGEKGPTVVSAQYIDTDTNGRIDHVKVDFDLNILDSSIDGYVDTNTVGAASTTWNVAGYTNARIDPTYSADVDNDTVVYFQFDEGLDYDTGAKPDLTATTASLTDNDGIQCFINETLTECNGVRATSGSVITTTVNELDAAKPVFVSVTARVGDRYIFVKFSENVWGQTGVPACGSGGELSNDAGSSTFDFAYTDTSASGVSSVESVDGTDSCASSDAFVRLFANVVYLDSDISSDQLKPYDGNSIFDAADNGISATHAVTIQQTVAPYVVAASSFYDDGSQYGIAGYWLRIVYSEPMSYQGAVTAANYTLAVDTPGAVCTTINGVPLSIRAISSSVYDLETNTQCTDAIYSITAGTNILDANEIEPVGSPNFATASGTDAVDATLPKLLQALSIDSTSVQITFSEPMSAGTVTDGTNYSITPDLGSPLTITATSDPSVYIISHPDTQTGTFYTISVTEATTPVTDIATNSIQAVPGSQATFRGQGSPIQTIEDGPLFTNPFADGSSFSFAFGFNNKIYLGPNDTDSGAFRFEPDGANPLAISFYDTVFAFSAFQAPHTQADGISFFQSGSLVDQGDATLKDFLFLVPVKAPKANYFWFTTDIDSQLDFYSCLIGTSANMVGGESISTTSKYMYMGITSTANGGKRPVLQSYSFDMTANTCTTGSFPLTDASNIPAIGDSGGNSLSNGSPIGIDIIYVDGTTMYVGNNGGLAWATVNDATAEPNAAADFTAVIDDTGASCTTGNVPTDWCAGSNRTLALNLTSKIPSGRKGLPFMITYNDGATTAHLLARNVTSSFGGTTRTGGELWKCTTTCTDLTNWSRVFTSTTQGSGTGMETTNNKAISMLTVNGDILYVGFDNEADGARVYSTTSVPTDKTSFTEIGRVDGATANCADHTGDTGGLGGFCYGYQMLSFVSETKQGYNYLYMTTGCKEQNTEGSICDTTVGGSFVAPPIRVLTQRD